VNELRVVFSDGKEYTVKPLNKKELDKKIAQKDFEGNVYKKMYDLCEKHYDESKRPTCCHEELHGLHAVGSLGPRNRHF